MNEKLKKMIQELREKKEKAALGGGGEGIKKNNEGERVTAREGMDAS